MIDPIDVELSHFLQVDVLNVIDGIVLHVTDVGNRFINGCFIYKMGANTDLRMLKRCWIKIYAGAPHNSMWKQAVILTSLN